MYDDMGDVPDGSYTVPFGEARIVREGDDVTIVALGRMVSVAEKAAAGLAASGIECTILDPRTTSPLDEETILESVGDTGRLVIVDESYPRCGMASDIAAIVAERGFKDLAAPIIRVTPPHTPVPYAPTLEAAFIPSPERVEEAVKKVMEG